MIIYILIILLFALSFLPKIRNQYRLRILIDRLHDFKFSNSILLIWIVLGFFTRLDFNQMWGCVINFGKVLDYNNIGFLTLSFTLILTARLRKKKRTINLLLIIELGVWLFRYIYYKGGYATGLTGQHPLEMVVLYDSVAITLRLINLNNNNRRLQFKTNWILVISIMLISIKFFFFPMPHDLFWETKRIQKKTETTKSLLIGNWTGTVEYDSTWFDTIPDDLNIFLITGADRTHTDSTHTSALKEMSQVFSDSAKISISHDLIASSKSPDCRMDYWASKFGSLKHNDSTEYGNFRIWKLDQDSLIITITEGFGKDYRYKLKRE